MRFFVVAATFLAVGAPCFQFIDAKSVCPSFEAWLAAHPGVTEDTPAVRAVFKANCERWAELNAIPGGAQFGPGDSAHLTPAQFAARFGGCVSATLEQAVETPQSIHRTPITIDWRTRGQVTPVKNQGAFGTCWSFAVAENLEGLNVRQGNQLTNISEQEFISCCPKCQGSAAPTTFAWLVNATDGRPALEATWPYTGSPGQCKIATAPKAPVKLRTWGRVTDDGTGRPIAEALVEKGPMGLGVDATCFHGYKSGVIRNCTSKGIDHAVLMVAAGEENSVPYFTIKNSWGSKWGEEGYVRIEQGHQWWGPISTVYTE